MTTIALPQRQGISLKKLFAYYNKYALVSLGLVTLFVLYFIMPSSSLFHSIHSYTSVLFLIFVPIIAFVFSIISLRQMYSREDHGMVLSYIALGVTSLYFMVALAIPFVLLGLYVLYTYVL